MTTRDLSEEEVFLTSIENQLDFGKSQAFRHDAIFHKYSREGKLNARQFLDASEVLRIKTKSKPGQTDVEGFLKALINPKDQAYRLNDLKILGLLLGQGDSSEKARLLFELNDPESSHILSKVQFNKSISKVFRIAIDILPILSVKSSISPKVSQYIERLKPSKPVVVEVISKLIFKKNKTSIKKTKFIKLFKTTTSLVDLLTSNGFRAFAQKFSKSATPSG